MHQNKVALITGASRGIGREIAIKLALEGFDILINYFKSKNKAEELASYLKKTYKVNAVAIKADISDEHNIKKLVDFSLKHFKKIDVLVNNAGICVDCEFSDRTVGQFINTFKTNLFGVFALSKLVGNIMKQNQYGKIINISSNNSINCFYPTTVDYDASKAALNSLTKNLAIEFAPYVNVNAIAPGWIDTEMNSFLSKEFMEFEKKKILKNRIGKPQDVANLVAFLVKDESDYINGEVIIVDGGMF